MIDLATFARNLGDLVEKPLALMSKPEILRVIGCAREVMQFPGQELPTLNYWAEVLEWHQSACIYRCHKGAPCETADGYRRMIENAGKLEKAARLLQDRPLAEALGTDAEADQPLSTGCEPSGAAPCSPQQLQPPWE